MLPTASCDFYIFDRIDIVLKRLRLSLFFFEKTCQVYSPCNRLTVVFLILEGKIYLSILLYTDFRVYKIYRRYGQPIFKMSSIEKYGGVEFIVASIIYAREAWSSCKVRIIRQTKLATAKRIVQWTPDGPMVSCLYPGRGTQISFERS